MTSTVLIQAARRMRNESHKSLIAVIRDHVSAWRKAEGWSRETVVAEIVQAHEAIGGPVASGILFDPATRDTFERMKVNADRVFRWLDDDSKDTNLLPANFLRSILAAMPGERRRQCTDDLLRPLGMAARMMAFGAGEGVDIAQVTAMIREGAEAHAAAAALLGGQATPATMAAARRVIFGAVDGLGERGKKQWRCLWNRIFKLQPGEAMEIITHQERLGWYHRKHMALEQRVFEAQEVFEHFRTFRAWLKIGAGHVEFVPGADGQLQAVPLSISYADMEQAQMEEFHDAAVAFLRSSRGASQLWPHLPVLAAGGMIDAILGDFGE